MPLEREEEAQELARALATELVTSHHNHLEELPPDANPLEFLEEELAMLRHQFMQQISPTLDAVKIFEEIVFPTIREGFEQLRVPKPLPTPKISDEAGARRLARVIAGDIILYNQSKISSAVEVEEALRCIVEEAHNGFTLFQRRVLPEFVEGGLFQNTLRDMLEAEIRKKPL